MQSIDQRDTIAAIATPIGEGGIAVIRVSGNKAIDTVDSVFKSKIPLKKAVGYTVHFGQIITQSGNKIDDVLATVFKSPKSYTGEDTVEISCHGGVLVTQQVLETVLEAGARSATAGEFTYRAFLNGKMDLSQAEAVADIIHAKSKKALSSAHQQMDGRLGEYIEIFRQDLIDATAMIELELDFTEEDVEFANKSDLEQLLSSLLTDIDNLLDTYETGRLIKYGISTVFIGAPNAGKSTLLNTLTGKERAIVTDIAGTTRDTIDADWNYEGLWFRLIDTAGIRTTQDIIEAEGVRRSQKAADEADIIIFLYDLSNGKSDEVMQILKKLKQDFSQKPVLVIGTKEDIENPRNAVSVEGHIDLKISALNQTNIDLLKKLIKEKALQNRDFDASSLLITSTRHKDALQKAKGHIQSALQGLKSDLSGDFISIDLRSALQYLGLITGQITNEDVLDSVFSRFCIGK